VYIQIWYDKRDCQAISMIKYIREVCGLGLKEAKAIVDDVLAGGQRSIVVPGSSDHSVIINQIFAFGFEAERGGHARGGCGSS
jgi:hypothetical protein